MNMLKHLFAAGLALPALALAQGAVLAPQAERISDSVIQQDYGAYERLQTRIKSLNDAGRRVADYHLAKAQCWLDVSFHEYTRNDRSDFPQAAMSESEKLIAAMEAHAEPLPVETPLVNGAAHLRPDLWERAQALKRGAGFSCAAQKTACAEVELVHAGNELNQQQWRHAKPYVQIAEDALADAQTLATQCLPPARVAAVGSVVVVVPVPAVAPVRTLVDLSANVVFDFDRSGPADIRAAGREQIDQLLHRVEAAKLRIVSVRLVGHADRLNSTGDRSYNQRLSERRAATVRALLVERGLDARAIRVEAMGDAGQIAPCAGKPESTAGLEECLLPNRRVTILVTAAATS